MKITGVKTFIVGANWRNLVFVKVFTNEGLVGVGEATLPGYSRAVVHAVEVLEARHVRGENPFNIERLWQRMYRDDMKAGGTVINSAISGIEIACWDIIGKKLKTPVYNLLGGRCHHKLRAYANGWYGGGMEPGDLAKQAEEVVSKGYKALKFSPFGNVGREISREEIEKAVDRVKAVRKAVGENVEILIEAFGRFSPCKAIKIAERMDKYNPLFYEEPVGPENIKAMSEVKKKVNIPIAAGERVYTKYGFDKLLNASTVDYIQPDIVQSGGILELKKIAAMAEPKFVSICPHNPYGPVASSAIIQVDFTCTNFFIQETLSDFDVPWWQNLVDKPPSIREGFIEISSRPGIGVELNDDEIEKHPPLPVEKEYVSKWKDEWETKGLSGREE